MPGMWSRKGLVLTGVLAILAGLSACTKIPPAAPARAHGPDGISIVRSAARLVIVVNQHPVHLTLELAGAELGVSEDDPSVWLVDGQIIQVAVVPRQAIYGAPAAQVSDQQLLLDHLTWEARYVSRELGGDVHTRPQACHTRWGASCLLWDYELPRGASHGAHPNLLLTTVVANQVVGLASPMRAGEDRATAEARLRTVLETITPREGWIDPAAEAVRLRLHRHD
jgi:hypothetical protein